MGSSQQLLLSSFTSSFTVFYSITFHTSFQSHFSIFDGISQMDGSRFTTHWKATVHKYGSVTYISAYIVLGVPPRFDLIIAGKTINNCLLGSTSMLRPCSSVGVAGSLTCSQKEQSHSRSLNSTLQEYLFHPISGHPC